MALISDLRAAIRALARSRGFTAIAISSLGVGIALAVTIVAVVNAYIVRGLPYPDSDRLVRIDYAAPGQMPPSGMERLEWSALDDVLEVSIAWDLDVFFMLGREYPESAPGAWVTPGYLHGFGVRAALGRTFTTSDYQPTSPPVAIISHRLWQTRFAGDAGIIGRTFDAYVSDRPDEAESFTIVGVLPADLWHLNVYTEVLAPLRAATYPYMARLRPGVSPALASERIDAFVRSSLSSVPAHFQVNVTSAHESYVRPIRGTVLAIAATAALVLLIAAANVSVLMLIRTTGRERELAVRAALGASHARVIRLLWCEAVIVASVSTALGLAIAMVFAENVGPLVETFLERRVPGGADALAIDSVVATAALIAFVITVVFTSVPVVAMWRANLSVGLASGGRTMTAARSGRVRNALIGVEVAASLTLLVGAGLMAETAVRMLRVEFGINASDVMTASLALRQRSFPDDTTRMRFFDQLTEQVASTAGVTSVALGDWWPLQGSRPRRIQTMGAQPTQTAANPFAVSSDYFATLGISVIEGRGFSQQDRVGSEAVAIVSQTLASKVSPLRSSLGEHLTITLEENAAPVTARIIGVVNDVRQSHSDNDLADVYFPLAQRPSRFAFLYIRGQLSNAESGIRSAVARVNPEVAVGTPRVLTAGIEQERARPRLLAFMLSGFAVAATVLAIIGMYGVIAYATGQRRREIAVRLAIGANARGVTTLLLRQGVVVLAAGLAGGVAGAWGLGRVLQTQLYGVRAVEPRVLAASAVAFAACALAAMAWPALRAARVDPALALKDE